LLIYDAPQNRWENADLTASTGISVTNGAGSLTITNTAPDQVVSLTGAGTTSISGTYPNFTVTSNDQFTGTVTSVTGTAPVVSSGGNTPAISMAAATGSVNGYLTSTDWNTFNNKTSNTGTVTSVGGTGTVNGLTLTGTVTTTGNLTLGGTLDLSSPPAIGGTTPAAGSFSSLTDSGNLTFTGTGNRILGDFSNATLANRLMFQNSVTNGATSVGILPNGTGLNSAYNVFAGSDVTNTSFGQFRVGTDTGDVRISSGNIGTGTVLPLTMYTGGIERLRIDTSGNVGIGISSPQGKFQVLNEGSLATDTDGNTSNTMIVGANKNATNNQGNLFIYSNSTATDGFGGSIGFGGFYSGTLVAAFGRIAGVRTGGSFTGALTFNTRDSGGTMPERMRITSGGSVLIANTAAVDSEKLRVTQTSNNLAVFIDITAASSTASPAISIRKQDNDNTTAQTYISFAFNAGASGAGGIQGNGATGVQFFSSSDQRLKENIINLDSQLNNILSIKPRKFDFIEGPKDCIGLIAQEIETIYPDVVGETPDGYKTVGGISIMEVRLIKAIQELKSELDSVKAELQTLKGS
jgi:hypothetical protein